MIGSRFQAAIVLGLLLANFGQAETEPGGDRAPAETRWARGMRGLVGVESVVVWDGPRATAYEVGRLNRWDRVRIQGVVRGGWLAIEAPSWAICWVERGAVELGEEGDSGRDNRREPRGAPRIAWVKGDGAVVRSGNPRASLPGPPRTRLATGTMVRLVDRPPTSMGRGPDAKSSLKWLAVAPPDDLVYFVRVEGLKPEPARTAAVGAEVLQAVYRPEGEEPKAGPKPPIDPPGLPREVAVELAGVDKAHRAVVTGRAPAAWRFEAERARLQAVLKRSGDEPGVREAAAARLKRLDRDERIAAAARDVEAVLADMRRLDAEIAAAERPAATGPAPRRPYDAIGFMKPSNQFKDGRKLYALIGSDGKTSAFLDLPPGLELEPITSGRVGVRGRAHFSEDLGAPLISVREVEPVVRGR